MKNRAASSASSHAAFALAFCLIGLLWAYLLLGETPRGQIAGQTVVVDASNQTVMTDADNKPLGECEINLSPASGLDVDKNGDAVSLTDALSSARKWDGEREKDARESRHTVSDKQGRFHLNNVPVGYYHLSASSRWHTAQSTVVRVSEGGITNATVLLKRSEPDLSVGDHQAVFSQKEKPFLPVRGYAALPEKGSSAPLSNRLHVKIWKTRLGDVLKRTDAAADLDKLRHSYDGKEAILTNALLHPNAADAPAPVLVADIDIALDSVDREGFFATHAPLPVAQQKPGLYLVKFSYRTFSACSYVLVTNLALVAKKSPRMGQTVVYAADLMSGIPVGGATVRLLRKSTTVAQSTTSANGVATLQTVPKQGGGDPEDESPLLTMATLGDDEAVVSGSSYNGSETKRYVVHVLTDRTVYRPGDTISYKTIVRESHVAENGAQSYSVPANTPATIEMRDASGGLVARQAKTTNAHGAVWGTLETSGEGATGTYTLTTSINGEIHESEVVIAAYRKPEFSVTVTPQKARYLRGETVQMVIKGTYYFGGPVAGGTVHYSVYRDADWSAEYGDEEKDDSDGEDASDYRSKSYQAYFGEGMGDGDIKLDENGQAIVSVRTDIRHIKRDDAPDEESDGGGGRKKPVGEEPIPQVETFTLTAQVQDEAKRSVEADGAASVAAGNVTIGVSPEGFVATPNKAMPVFVTVRDGATKAPKPGVTVTLSAVYDTWNALKKETVAIPLSRPQTAQTGSDGRAIFPVTPPRSGEIRLLASVSDDGNRVVKAEGNLWAATDKGEDLDTDYGDLSLLTDKRQYGPGDTAKILVNASRTGQSVLLSVEGDRVYQTVVVGLPKRSTVVYLPIKAEWGPNVTLSANYVQNKKFASSETPLRVSLPAQKLTVSVRPVNPPQQNKYQPGDNATFAVSIKNAQTGKPVASDFALGVVDESIYALREDNPQATKQTFFPRRTNRVSTSYSFSVEYLGDVSKAEPKIKARTKFRDTAYWRPDGQTGENGEATVFLTLPDNLTTWRATVQAVSDRTSVGYGRTKIVSAKPFFVRLETPRYLVSGDKSTLTGLVHNDTEQAQDVRVKLAATGLHVDGDATQSLTLAPGAVGTVHWPVAPEGNGVTDRANLRLTAWTFSKEVGRKAFNDGIERTLPLRPYGREEAASFAGVMDAGSTNGDNGDTKTLNVSANAIASQTRLRVRVTPSLRGAIKSGADYLIGFPYGCTEQTLSRFYPDLLAEQNHLIKGGTTTNQADLPRMVRDGITRLGRMQHSATGGWGWWEQDADDPFMTAYALVGLAFAKQSGYEVSDEMLTSGKKAAEKMASTAPVRSRPFLLYALHQAGYEDTNGLLRAPFKYGANRTNLVPAKLPADALAYLVLLGHDLNENTAAFYNELGRRGTKQGSLLHYTAYPKNQSDYSCSDRMASALALRVFLAVRPDDARVPFLVHYLMQSRTGGYFGDTRDTAWTLVAFCDYLRAHPREAQTPTGSLSLLVNDKPVDTIQIAGDNRMDNGEVVLTLPAARLLHPGANTLRFVRSGGGSGEVFYSGELTQIVSAPQNSDLPAVSVGGVRITREVVRVVPRKTGNSWQLTDEPVGNGPIAQGDRLRIRLTVVADRDTPYVLIEDTFPSGAEVTERGTADEDVDESDASKKGGAYFWPDHVDVRDDKIAFFARKLPKGRIVLQYNLRAQTPGTGRALPASVRPMYDNAVRGESSTTVVEVRP